MSSGFISRILGFLGDDHEECRILVCGVLLVLLEPTFQRARYDVSSN
jgi:hypothetical protein